MTGSSSTTALHRLVDALCAARGFDHPVTEVRVIETHISLVVLTGPYAYKFKKPVDFGFLDFSTLSRRIHSCEEEVRLNRRLSPDLYLGVRFLGGDRDRPQFDATPVLEPCVVMVQFPAAAELDRLVQSGSVGVGEFQRLASDLAAFHGNAARASAGDALGSPALVRRQCLDNFTVLDRCADPLVARLRAFTEAELDRWDLLLAQRQAEGRVKEGHGDLHLTNLIFRDGRIQAFDCIEFSRELSYCDVMSDIAFLMMDLDDRGHPEARRAFLDRYLEVTGDFGGVPLLPLFLVYRGLVRAKVAWLRAEQALGTDDEVPSRAKVRRHLDLAALHAAPPPRCALILTYGFSGSGKTAVGTKLLQAVDLVRVRSDVERKRLAEVSANDRGATGIGEGLYGPRSTEQTYERLASVAADLLDAGVSVLVDATFLSASHRDRFRRVAEGKKVRWRILEMVAPDATLRQRVAQRRLLGVDASDADAAVLEHQLVNHDDLTADERRHTVTIDTSQRVDGAAIGRQIWAEG